MTYEISMLRKELCMVALSIVEPSAGDLAYTIESATSKCTGKKLSKLNWMCRSRERSQNEAQSYKFVR